LQARQDRAQTIARPAGWNRGDGLEHSLFGFIWKHSRRDQIVLLIATISLFPLLYLSLELPKRIINDAIGAETDPVTVYGTQVDQVTFLMVLCVLFLVTVTVHGLLKMRVNTMQGIMAERLLRRLRFTLIARIMRFPSEFLDRTSEGELVSMVTAETEPMGGLMGDAIAQPVLQAGQMLTILLFLFSQSFAFGMAAIAFIPLQAWLIPRLQRRVNRLNKKRTIEVRALAGEIGTSAVGAPTLRTNGGWGQMQSVVSDRLSRLVAIRFQIYQKKFFMKFVNNFISQLTPFFFYAVGGYLVIRGDISIGALVAALAAFKDLSGPWKELLTYYNVAAEMGQRWELLSERFTPEGIIAGDLFEGDPEDGPSLAGDIVLRGLDMRNAAGDMVLSGASATLPAGRTVHVLAPAEEDRRALAGLLQRELKPLFGSITVAGHPLEALHQKTIFQRIGFASSRPVVFDGSFLDNLMLPLHRLPPPDAPLALAEIAAHTGERADHLRAWWFELITGLQIADPLFERGLGLRLPDRADTALAGDLPRVREKVAEAIGAANLGDNVRLFRADAYNPALPVAENILFAISRDRMTAERVAEQQDFLALLTRLDLDDPLNDLAFTLIDTLLNIFGEDGDGHPLFRKLDLEQETYHHVTALLSRRAMVTLTDTDRAHLMAVLFAISSEKLGIDFEPEVTERILHMRATHGAALRDSLGAAITTLDPVLPIPGLPVLENAVFGMVVARTPAEEQALRGVVAEVLREAGAMRPVLDLILDLPVVRTSGNLPAQLSEALAVCRASVKRPDLLILDEPLASFDSSVRAALPANLRSLLPEATILSLRATEQGADTADVQLRLQNGQLVATGEAAVAGEGNAVRAELGRKLRVLEGAPLFSGLERKQQRLLAFGSRWYNAKAGDYVFRQDDDPDSGVFLIASGTAELIRRGADGTEEVVATVGPGALVGELGLIRQVPRALDMRAAEDMTCLNIGEEEFMAVVQNDAATAYRVLQVVAGYV
jgi:ABC-type multidrug transport system fused ATPase/permease subunit